MRQAGFTLIEILVVVLIISIVTGVAVLSIRHNDNKEMENFATEIRQLLSLAEEQAILQPAVLGLVFSEHRFQFATLQQEGTHLEKHWVAMQDHLLGQHRIPRQIQVSGIHLANDPRVVNPQIVISANGDVSPFTLYIGKPGGRPQYMITGDGDGNVTQQSLS